MIDFKSMVGALPKKHTSKDGIAKIVADAEKQIAEFIRKFPNDRTWSCSWPVNSYVKAHEVRDVYSLIVEHWVNTKKTQMQVVFQDEHDAQFHFSGASIKFRIDRSILDE